MDAIDAAKAVIATHEDFVHANDLESIMSNFAEDVVIVAAGMPPVEGAGAVRELYTAMLGAGRYEDFTHDYIGAAVEGDTVVLHGIATFNLIPKEGEALSGANGFLIVAKPDKGGAYRFWRVAFAPAS